MDMDFKKVVAWLKRNKINYTIKNNSIVLFDDSNGKVVLVFNTDRITPKAPRGVLMPSSAADGSDFYVQVGDWGKWINEFLAWAKDRGYYEYNHYRNSQWGTWKFGNFISMSFFGVFIKKIITLKNGVNESMNLREAKELLENAGYIVEGAKTDDAFLAHINRQRTNRQRTNKPRTNLIPAQEAQLTAYTKVMAIVDDLVNWISENGEDSGVSEYILNQLLKAQKIEKQGQSVK